MVCTLFFWTVKDAVPFIGQVHCSMFILLGLQFIMTHIPTFSVKDFGCCISLYGHTLLPRYSHTFTTRWFRQHGGLVRTPRYVFPTCCLPVAKRSICHSPATFSFLTTARGTCRIFCGFTAHAHHTLGQEVRCPHTLLPLFVLLPAHLTRNMPRTLVYGLPPG